MEKQFTLFIVDDDIVARITLEAIFSKEYEVELFESAEACLERAIARQPDLFLLDVGLPGMDGYQLCRELKNRPETAGVPVIFVSGIDDLESRLHGYDMGGDDFITKPYSAAHIERRVATIREAATAMRRLLDQAAESDELVSLVLSNIDEYAILIQFLRALNTCADGREVAQAMLSLLRKYRLNGAVQLRLGGRELNIGEHGENNALEVSILNHVRKLDRIFEFKSRAVFNFEVITVMINNMPTQEPEVCGRIRDNLAIAAESANTKLLALQTAEDYASTRQGLGELLVAVRQAIEDYGRKYNRARYEGAILSREMLDDLVASFSDIGISFQQEEALENLIKEKTASLIDLYDFGGVTAATLETLGQRLNAMLAEEPAISRNDAPLASA